MRRLLMSAMLVASACAVSALDSPAQVSKGVASGVLKKFDAKTGAVVLEVQVRIKKTKKKENKEMEFKINNETKVQLLAGVENETQFGLKALKSPKVKVGAQTSVFFDKDNKVYEMRVGAVTTKKKAK